MDATTALKRIKEINPRVPFIIITGYSDIRIAVNVMKMGALDYLTKPMIPEEMLQVIKNAFANENASDTSSSSGEIKNSKTNSKDDCIFSDSIQSREILRQIELVAPTNYSVIIYGESGSGKEAVAQTIHKRSKRAHMPFVAMDCGAISKELAGSELFGHEKGSFTGAWTTKIGHFELANGGTIFLDEIANLSYDTQSSLLRVIQERKLKRIGGNKEIPFDVRIIIASNENLAEAYKKGKFREDLYHRFNEFHITIPPLRERRSDIMFYANFFLDIANRELGKNLQGFDDEVVSLFTNYSWYGNLREMKNVIRRATLLSDGKKIRISNLPFDFVPYAYSGNTNISNMTNEIPQPANTSFGETVSKTPIEEIKQEVTPTKEVKPDLKSAALEAEYALILKVLKQVNFNKSKAAKILNVNRKTLYNKMKSLQLLNKENSVAEV